MADTERTLGALGTVEEAYCPKDSPTYQSSREPKRPFETTVCGSVPTKAKRERLAHIDAQQAKNIKRKATKGGYAEWAEFVGYARSTDTYGIKVKVKGIRADIYWLSWTQANVHFYEITGYYLSEVP